MMTASANVQQAGLWFLQQHMQNSREPLFSKLRVGWMEQRFFSYISFLYVMFACVRLLVASNAIDKPAVLQIAVRRILSFFI